MSDEPRKPGWLRDSMPGVASIVDEFCEVFGDAVIKGGIREMMQEGTFWAEDYTTGAKYGEKPKEPRGVIPIRYKSPNGTPSMLDVKRGRR